MRGFRNFIVSILSAIIIVVLAIFAVQNLQGITAHFIGMTFTPSVWWVSIGSAVLGFLLALLILAPGRIASGWRARSLTREQLRREQEMSILRQEHDSLRAQHAHLQAEREGLQTERDQLRARLAAANEVPTVATTTSQPAGVNTTRMYSDGADSSIAEPAVAQQSALSPDGANYRGTTGDVYTPEAQPDGQQPVTEPVERTDTAVPVNQTQHQQLGVGGRLRGIFSRPREERVPADQSWTNDQPPVPTA